MTYPEVLNYLDSFADYEKNTQYSYKKDLKLARIQGFLSLLKDPQDFLRVIHVAGTKGKGSVCAFVAYILRESGFTVGLFTSPHLNDFRERIRILRPTVIKNRSKAAGFEGMISKRELTYLVKEVKPLISKYNYNSKYGRLTFFEIYTALAFLYFKRRQVNFVVLETGMGGRLDSTNTACSLVCGISPISLDHMQKLGRSLSRIAIEKAGIIKRNKQIVISACQKKEVSRIINDRCKKFCSTFYEVGKEIKYFKSRQGFNVQGLFKKYKNLRLRLLGEHQVANAALAVGLVEAASLYGFNISEPAIRAGLYNTIWPGRCEIINRRPLVVLDGAQNLASALALKKAISDNFICLPNRQRSVFSGRYKKIILVLGISADKDISGICKVFNSLADEIILTQANTKRAASAEKLAKYFRRKLYLTQSVKEAKILANRLAKKEDLILVTGSLFVVGEYRDV